MTNYLTADQLMGHVHALADDIGPRPAGTAAEARAHAYVRTTLQGMGMTEIESLPFAAPDTWGYELMIPALLAMAGNGLRRDRIGHLLGGALALFGAYTLYHVMGVRRSALVNALQPTGPSSTQIVRIPPISSTRNILVLIGHVDANRHRLTFAPVNKHFLQIAGTAGILAAAANGLIQLARAIGDRHAYQRAYRWSLLGLVTGFLLSYLDEQGEFIDGANDNATAVACLLGLAGYLKKHPLQHTEVWLAFTGSEESGCLGTHALLDAYGEQLKDAYFLDFEMVGAGDLAFVTHHRSFSHFTSYRPDAYSSALAAKTAHKHPQFGVKGRPMLITEEVGALRSRGFRGLCLVGVGEDGFLVNWHQRTDTSAHIIPAKIENAARFALAFAQELDET